MNDLNVLNRKDKDKVPSKILYNLEHMVSPRDGDPKSNIVLGQGDKNRIARDRQNLSPTTVSSK